MFIHFRLPAILLIFVITPSGCTSSSTKVLQPMSGSYSFSTLTIRNGGSSESVRANTQREAQLDVRALNAIDAYRRSRGPASSGASDLEVLFEGFLAIALYKKGHFIEGNDLSLTYRITEIYAGLPEKPDAFRRDQSGIFTVEVTYRDARGTTLGRTQVTGRVRWVQGKIGGFKDAIVTAAKEVAKYTIEQFK